MSSKKRLIGAALVVLVAALGAGQGYSDAKPKPNKIKPEECAAVDHTESEFLNQLCVGRCGTCCEPKLPTNRKRSLKGLAGAVIAAIKASNTKALTKLFHKDDRARLSERLDAIWESFEEQDLDPAMLEILCVECREFDPGRYGECEVNARIGDRLVAIKVDDSKKTKRGWAMRRSLKVTIEEPIKEKKENLRRAALAQEAVINLRALVDTIIEQARSKGASSYPVGDTGWTPQQACCEQPDQQCISTDEQWQDDIWREFQFKISGAHSYQYSYSSVDGKTFKVRARGDLDCDGEFGLFERAGFVDGTNPVGQGGTSHKNPLE